jgi:type II secretory pathway component PulF
VNQVWRYNSPLGEGEGPQRPPLIAESREEAEYILGRLGVDDPRLELDPGATLSVLLNPKMNRRELARFYRTLGRRAESGDNLVAAITQILDFLEDTVLLSSAIRLAILMRSGVPMGRAMKEAGFPEKDASAIMAMGEAGRIGEALESLADDHMRDHTLQSSISKVLMTPKIFLVIVTGVIWGSMTFMVPQMIGKLQEIVPKDKIPAFAMSAYHVGKWMNDNILISTLFFVGGLIGLFFFTRSKRFTQWMDNIKLVRELSMRVDMAAMWRSFAVLYEAGFNISQAAHIVADSARREDSESSFRGLGVLLASKDHHA